MLIKTLLAMLVPNFLLHATAVPCPQFFATSSVSATGNISSPNYPNPYPADADCTYILQGSEYQGMKLTFHDFDLEPPYTAGCLSDYIDLDIYDLRDRMTFHKRFCGGSLPGPLLVLHPKAKLVFRSNHAVHRRGFSASYEFVDEGAVTPPKSNLTHLCGEFPTSGGGGIIHFPGQRAEEALGSGHIDCLWLLRVSRNHKIHVRIQELEFQGSAENCQRAQLGLYDGYEHSLDETTVLKKFCGDKKHYKGEDDRGLLSSRNRLLVRFTTSMAESKDAASLDKNFGFRIVWSEVSSDETPAACSKKKRFPCKETRACITKDHLGTFSTCPQLIYCISNDLVCDGIPHCAETDASDERGCYGRFLNVLIIGVPIILLTVVTVAFATFLIKRKHMLKKVSVSSLLWKKEKVINGYVMDNLTRNSFATVSRLEATNPSHLDTSSIESASICPLSDSESSDISVCPFHGHKFMNHLPVLHEVYNLDSDDSSTITPSDSRCERSHIIYPSMIQSSPRQQLHTWRLKNRPITRTNAVCLSDECKSSSGDESPCPCGGGQALSTIIHNDKIEDSGVELPDSFDMHSNLPHECACDKDKSKKLGAPELIISVHRAIQTDETYPIMDESLSFQEKQISRLNEYKAASANTNPSVGPSKTIAIGTQTSRNMLSTLCSTVTTFGVYPESTSTDV